VNYYSKYKVHEALQSLDYLFYSFLFQTYYKPTIFQKVAWKMCSLKINVNSEILVEALIMELCDQPA